MHSFWKQLAIAFITFTEGCTNSQPSSETPLPLPPEGSQSILSKDGAHGGCVSAGDCLDTGPILELGVDKGLDELPEEPPVSAPGIPGSILSPSGRLALVWPAKNQIRHIELYDVIKKRRINHVTIPSPAVARPERADVFWTAGDNILLGWSAGSDTSLSVLYDPKGKILLRLMSSGMNVSPSKRYLVTYPTLFAEPPGIEVYDLSTGRQITRRAANENIRWSAHVQWKGHQLIVYCHDTKGESQELQIDLEAPP